MSRAQEFRVLDPNGLRGKVITTSRFLDDNPHRLIRLEDGRELLVPRQLLRPQEDGSFLLTVPLAELLNDKRGGEKRPSDTHRAEHSRDADHPRDADMVIPVMEEEVNIERKTVDTGRIRINKRVETNESLIDEPLLRQGYEIERTSVNRIIEEVPKPHYDGDTLVLPILEEVLVVEKRLVLREEVRITPKREEVRDPQTHSVRREHVEVERV